MARAQGGRERILNAAIALFGARGVDAVTVRDIASSAECSPALVVHHFGSKAGLREAADQQVMALIAANRAAIAASVESAARGGRDLFGYAAFMNVVANPTLASYVRRIIIDGGPAAAALLSAAVGQAGELQREQMAAGTMRPTEDLETRAAILISQPLGLLLMREPLAAVLGYDPLSEEGLPRWLATLEQVITRGIITPPA